MIAMPLYIVYMSCPILWIAQGSFHGSTQWLCVEICSNFYNTPQTVEVSISRLTIGYQLVYVNFLQCCIVHINWVQSLTHIVYA